MKKKYRFLISAILVLVILLTTMPYTNVSAYSDSDVFGEEGYRILSEDLDGYSKDKDSLLYYVITKEAKNGQNGTVSVLSSYMRNTSGEVDFNLCQEVITIPETITLAGLTYTVNIIEKGAFEKKALKKLNLSDSIVEIKSNVFNNSKLESFKPSKNLQKVGYCFLSYCYYLTKIVDNPENPYFTAKDNALYSEDFKTLYAVANLGNSYTVREGTNTITAGALKNMILREITMPVSLKSTEFDDYVANLIFFKTKIPKGFNGSFIYALVPKGMSKYAKNLNLDGYVVEKIPYLSENTAFLKKINWSSKDALKTDSKLTTAQRSAIKKTAVSVTAETKTDLEKVNRVFMYISQNKTLDSDAIYTKNDVTYGLKESYDYAKYNSTWGAYKIKNTFYEGACRLGKEMLSSIGIASYIVKIYDDVIPTYYLIVKLDGTTYIYNLLGGTYGNYNERFYPVDYGYNIPLNSFSATERFVSILK